MVEVPSIVWVDFRQKRIDRKELLDLSKNWRVLYVDGSKAIDEIPNQSSFQPYAIIGDFGLPSVDQLERLQALRGRFKAVPSIILCDHFTEWMFLWALRTRIWNVFFKPINSGTLVNCVNDLQRMTRSSGGIVVPHSVFDPAAEDMSRYPELWRKRRKTDVALSYVAARYREKISLREAARLCNMSSFEFSRAFKSEQGINFRKYVNQYRIDIAKTLLARPTVRIKEVAYDVGFDDLAYFTKVFRHNTGTTPSAYQRSAEHTVVADKIHE